MWENATLLDGNNHKHFRNKDLVLSFMDVTTHVNCYSHQLTKWCVHRKDYYWGEMIVNVMSKQLS